MANLNGFDADKVDPSVPQIVLPEGNYLAIITASENKTNAAGNGHFLQLRFVIAEGQYTGCGLYARLNMDNPNPLAVQIARSELSAICRAVGVMRPTDSADLHNLPLTIKVVCKRRQDNGEMANEIKAFAPKTAATAAPEAADHTNAAPWQR